MSIFDRERGRGDSRSPDQRVTVESRDGGRSVTVVDRIERRQYVLETPATVAPRPADPDRCLFPVDAAVEVTAESVELPNVVVVCVRDADGRMLAQAEQFAHETFPEGTYSVEVCAPIKIYLHVESELAVFSDAERTRIEFGEETRVTVGARSHHDRPGETITTTGDVEDVMHAVSAFGSALKTLSPERSFPTLRGHPPAVELGDELDVPPALEVPDAGIRIEVPRDHGAVYTVAPLAYYLGAEVVPGTRPRVVTDDGFEHYLGGDGRSFEDSVERTLKQVFLLDCVTRTEGLYQFDLHERAAIEDDVDLEFATLYDASVAERTEQYLGVPYERVADHVPEWKLTTHVRPAADSVESLPFLVDDLAVIRSSTAETIDPSTLLTPAAGECLGESDFTRGESTDQDLVQPPEVESLEQAWVGEGIPLGSSKMTPRAFQNRLERQPTSGNIDITVVCNEDSMREEETVVGYGNRDRLPFDVTVHNSLTVAELRSILASSTDFLHYIGHIDADGFECADGRLDATELDAVGVDAFLLNACHSYDQGLGLIDAGAVGGIVTLDAVVNSGAVRMGRALARLLDRGFPLGSALEVARDESIVGRQYLVVGDGGISITQAESGTPHVCSIDRTGEGFEVTIETYPTNAKGLGTLFTPHIQRYDRYYLTSGELETFEVNEAELSRFLSLENVPVVVSNELRWSENLSVRDL